MSVRKIASNYVFLPGYPLLKNGYVVLEESQIVDVVDRGGYIREIQGLEFYGGMLLAGFVAESRIHYPESGSLIDFFEKLYADSPDTKQGLSLLKGADLRRLVFQPGTMIERLVWTKK